MLFWLIAQIALKRQVLLRVRFRETQAHVEVTAQSMKVIEVLCCASLVRTYIRKSRCEEPISRPNFGAAALVADARLPVNFNFLQEQQDH
jgi:hypothetical protein